MLEPLYSVQKNHIIMPNSRTGIGGTVLGELISLQSDHREPSTEPLANLEGMGRRTFLKKISFIFMLSSVLLLTMAGTALADDSKLERMVEEVVGTPYKWGGTTVKGFDCSGFMQYVFDKYDVELSRTSKSQAKMGVEVDKDELRAGDLVFFNTDGKGISHAGIYLGDGKFAHSSSTRGVSVNKLNESYYVKRYVTARRIVNEEIFNQMTNIKHDA